jgi:hypothetical protein
MNEDIALTPRLLVMVDENAVPKQPVLCFWLVQNAQPQLAYPQLGTVLVPVDSEVSASRIPWLLLANISSYVLVLQL